MSGMMGASMLRTRRRDVNLKPNRRLDRKSSRGMLYENEELRLRTININAEVERGQSDIKKLKRENEQLKREILALRYEYDRLDTMLRERRYSPDHSDESASVCSVCPECATDAGSAHVAFHDLCVVPEEDAEARSGAETPCNCEECTPANQPTTRTPDAISAPNNVGSKTNKPSKEDNGERTVDVIVHDAPPQFFESITSPPHHVTNPPPPPPGFVVSPYQVPRFRTGGNVEDLLGDVHGTTTTFVQQNSVFMCNTRKVTQHPCCCSKNGVPKASDTTTPSKSFVTEKNIELTYDYPKSIPVTPPTTDEHPSTTTEVASTVVFVERRIPVRPKKFDFFFRSRSAPVGENEEPIYATVNKLPKKLRRMDLANLEREVAYKPEQESSTRTEATLKTDSEQSPAPHLDDDTSPSEREKSVVPQRPDTTKTKKRKRFSLTFKKRERKRREKKKEVTKNGVVKNGGPPPAVESDSERLLEVETRHRLCSRHRPRNTVSSSSSGPRYKRDSYHEMTTSHSEPERTNSVCSSVNSLGSACTHKSRKLSAPAHDGNIPWCGCWGAGCL